MNKSIILMGAGVASILNFTFVSTMTCAQPDGDHSDWKKRYYPDIVSRVEARMARIGVPRDVWNEVGDYIAGGCAYQNARIQPWISKYNATEEQDKRDQLSPEERATDIRLARRMYDMATRSTHPREKLHDYLEAAKWLRLVPDAIPGQTYYSLLAMAAGVGERFPEVLPDAGAALSELMKIDPGNAKWHYLMAILNWNSNPYRSETYLQQAIRCRHLTPELRGRIQLLLAAVHSQQGQIESKKAEYIRTRFREPVFGGKTIDEWDEARMRTRQYYDSHRALHGGRPHSNDPHQFRD